jgi:aminoglycoside phosphotransferase (APT) family kinase protein
MAEPQQNPDLPGYKVRAVEDWIANNVEGLTPPFEWTQLEGGHSNLTYRLVDIDGRQAVVRRPPEGELLPKAHDMSREWALISSLAETPVPVPAAYGFCEDPGVTGAWFYVMGWVEGHPLYNDEDTAQWVPESERTKAAHSFIDVLAELHSVDPDEVGLGSLGKKENYVARQLKTWYRSWTSSIEDAQHDDPRAHELQRFFLENVPEQGPARVVHGDYGLHNVLIGPNHTIAAVVDWEISTLGDPLADLAYAVIQFPDPAAGEPAQEGAAASAPGFPSRASLAQRYAEKTGRSLDMLDFYIGFNRWKGAAIVHGVYARYMAGQKSTEGVDMEALFERMNRSMDLAEEAYKRLTGNG